VLNKACRRVGSGIGYLLYVFGILILLLWFLLPQETMRRSLEAGLGRIWPEFHWRIGAMTIAMPPSLVLSDVQGYDRAGDKRTLIRLDRVTAHLQLLESLKARRLLADYRVEIGKGSIAGHLSTDFGFGNIQMEGTAQRINLADIPWVHHHLRRVVHGLASGRFSGAVAQHDRMPSLEADIRVESGRVGLKQPILNHSELPFSLAAVTVQSRGETIQLDKGMIESELLDGCFSGAIILHTDPMLSQVTLQGDVQPKKKFFKAVSNTLAYEAFRLQLKESPFPFTITGTLVEPGIHYGEYAILFQKLEKELR